MWRLRRKAELDRGAVMRVVMAGVVVVVAGGARAQEADPLEAVKGDRWDDARAAADRIADPVAGKLVDYLRLRAPGAATASEIAAFVRENPDWPAQALLEHRRQEAIASDPDDAAVLAQCDTALSLGSLAPGSLALAPATLRCARAIANSGRTADADALARWAWVNSVDTAAEEAAFLGRWGGVALPEDQWARFRRLAWNDPAGALRQITHVDRAHHAAAEARLAAKRDEPGAEALAAALPAELRADPGLVLDRVRALRHAGRAGDAAVLLGGAAVVDNWAAFWTERNLLARALLHDGDAKAAYGVAAAHGAISDEQLAEAEFLAGFIALRMLHQPARAEAHFRTLAGSHAAITQARAHYWLARTYAERSAGAERSVGAEADAETVGAARAEYEKAATWTTTYYGQLSALALGEAPMARISALNDPAWSRDAALGFMGHEVFRAAVWLIAWGDRQRARAFLMGMDEVARVPAERALVAAFASAAGLPDSAVFVARRMGRDGMALPRLGWPSPYHPMQPPDATFSLGIMRQESSFDMGAVSPSGARGLMQLMPATATAVAKQLGVPGLVQTLTSDAGYNMRLGTAYLREMLTKFDNCLPLAAAAYNAGPHRVAQWLADNRDPRQGPVDMVDWIELIPVGETRNYVQRVTENVVMYRADFGDNTPVLTGTPWTR